MPTLLALSPYLPPGVDWIISHRNHEEPGVEVGVHSSVFHLQTSTAFQLLLLAISHLLLPRGGWRSPQLKTLEFPRKLEMNHPTHSLRLLVLTAPSPQPHSAHSSKETSHPIPRASLRQHFSSPSRRAMRRSQRGWPAGMVLAAAACRHAEKSAVLEKQQNSNGFGGREETALIN